MGCVDISVEPHFVRDQVSEEVLELSKEYVIYGLCDDGMIICKNGAYEYVGEVYRLINGNIEQIC